jgi:hypothetical protein
VRVTDAGRRPERELFRLPFPARAQPSRFSGNTATAMRESSS